MTETLWGATGGLDAGLADYTAGGDRLWDRRLLRWDVLGTMAHVDGLAAIGVLSGGEHAALDSVLQEALGRAQDGSLTVTDDDEDVHTALERFLVRRLGKVGEKVHTGRSRNDQVLTALRLFCKDRLIDLAGGVLDLADRFVRFARRHEDVTWPGYTHQRRAMPSTVGLWAASYAEGLTDDLELLWAAFGLVDRSPLGSAAGYGVPLPLDRELTAARLGFAAVQGNVAAVQPSRGKLDVAVLAALWAIAHDLGKFSWDVILFSADEYGFVRLPQSLATGSSIMPHKANPDLFELTRARAALLVGWTTQAMAVAAGLPGGYHRDLQVLKEPLMRGLDTVGEMVAVLIRAVPRLRVDREACAAAVSGDLLATEEVFRRVRSGVPFRRAYREVAAKVRAGQVLPPLPSAELVAARTATGAPGNLGLDLLARRITTERRRLGRRRRKFASAVAALAGGKVKE